MSRIAVLIVAGGKGLRAGAEAPKQWQSLLGRRVVDWSIDAFSRHPAVTDIVVVAGEDLGAPGAGQRFSRAEPGATRTQSVMSGLAALALPDEAKVLIHDAARPGIDEVTINALIEALDSSDAAAPALPVSDAPEDRKRRPAQNRRPDRALPGADPAGLPPRRHSQRAGAGRADLVDDLAAVEAAGARVTLVAGSLRLSKITYPEDFDMMSRLLAPSGAPRVGKGFDVHAFEAGDHVTLCGVRIPHTARLKGHSDADAGWHALTDAILGAAALGDIGDHFPPSDPRWKDADSGIFLRHSQLLAESKGYRIDSCDITVICEAPRVKPHREAMRARTAELLGLPLDAVSVKATTTEGLGFTGRREGIAAEAIAVLAPLR